MLHHTGHHPEYMRRMILYPETKRWCSTLIDKLYRVGKKVRKKKRPIIVALYCDWGRHSSVGISSMLASALESDGAHVQVDHPSLKLWDRKCGVKCSACQDTPAALDGRRSPTSEFAKAWRDAKMDYSSPTHSTSRGSSSSDRRNHKTSRDRRGYNSSRS